MFRKRAWVIIFAKFLLAFILLSLPWPYFAKAYVNCFSSVWTAVFSDFVKYKELKFALRPTDTETTRFRNQWSVSAYIRNVDSKKEKNINKLDLRRTAFIPAAVYLSLVLAIVHRIRRKKEIAASATGFLLLQSLSGIPIIVLLQQMGLTDLHFNTQVVVLTIYRALVTSPGMSYAIPALLWLLFHWWSLKGLILKSNESED